MSHDRNVTRNLENPAPAIALGISPIFRFIPAFYAAMYGVVFLVIVIPKWNELAAKRGWDLIGFVAAFGSLALIAILAVGVHRKRRTAKGRIEAAGKDLVIHHPTVLGQPLHVSMASIKSAMLDLELGEGGERRWFRRRLRTSDPDERRCHVTYVGWF
ncbi:MAG: hypothetical protein LC808_21000, partial [Actinobacteria bacterium]|nr:hypothetical protein [Actinomycetota bacterium]